MHNVRGEDSADEIPHIVSHGFAAVKQIILRNPCRGFGIELSEGPTA